MKKELRSPNFNSKFNSRSARQLAIRQNEQIRNKSHRKITPMIRERRFHTSISIGDLNSAPHPTGRAHQIAISQHIEAKYRFFAHTNTLLQTPFATPYFYRRILRPARQIAILKNRQRPHLFRMSPETLLHHPINAPNPHRLITRRTC